MAVLGRRSAIGLFPILGLLVGEDHSLPKIGLRRSGALVAYLDNLPRIYAGVWVGTLAWAAEYVARSDLSAETMAGLIVSVGIGSAVALPTAHELLHRRSGFDERLGRLMTALCCYGHMAVEHFHHHATVGDPDSGATAQRGMSVYRFALSDFLQGLRNAWSVERSRLRRSGQSWWHNQVVRGYSLSLGLFAAFLGIWGKVGAILFIGQALFAVFTFEVITYVHHYGLVRNEGEEAGPQHGVGASLLDNELPHVQQHLPQRPPPAPEDSLLRVARHARFAAAAGELLHHALRGPRASAVVHADRPAARRARTSAGESRFRAAGMAARGALPLVVTRA